MSYDLFMNKELDGRLPFVRINKIELTNFKGVKHGELELNGYKEYIPFDTKSDILGLYGQNGSGKSSVVDALNVIKGLLSGFKLGNPFVKFIDVDSEYAIIKVEFDFQFRDGRRAPVIYSVKLSKSEKCDTETDEDNNVQTQEYCLHISDETLHTKIYADNTIRRSHPIINTTDELFCGDTAASYFFGEKYSSIKEELIYLKRKSYEDGRSFVFNPKLAELLHSSGVISNYSELLVELYMYATRFLHIVGTRSSGLVQLRVGIPLFLPFLNRPLLLAQDQPVPAEFNEPIKVAFEQINTVVGSLIPDLQLSIKTTPTTLKNGKPGIYVNILSIRENSENAFPFEYESDGIIKIVCILADYIVAFNQGSTTLVVDEFDSGVFEYLLGELLQIFESAGKGQFIFTSHNLRPLEVIDKKFIRFTTADPYDRYYKLPNVSGTNNLRDLYLRSVQIGGQDVEIYRKTKSFKMIKALIKAGEGYLK